jgi:hypothetical protein
MEMYFNLNKTYFKTPSSPSHRESSVYSKLLFSRHLEERIMIKADYVEKKNIFYSLVEK